MLTLAAFEIPTGLRAWIEDVVADDAARGRGVASALVQAALAARRELGARTVDLTSRPDREAANRLYLRLGFEQRRPTCTAGRSSRGVSRRPRLHLLRHSIVGGKAAGNRRISVVNIGVNRPSPQGRSGSLAKAWLSTPTMSVDTR